ncbi:MAG: MMPL family transporter [Thermodesulfobacteriota bacterium]
MNNFRNKIEAWFERYAQAVFHHRIKTILIMLILTGALVSQIPRITIDTSTEGFLHTKDPALIAYNDFRDQFGRDEIVIVAIQSPNIFSQAFLKKLKQLHEDLEETVPYIDDMTSLINVRNTRGEADELIVEDLLEHWPQNQDEMTALKKRVLKNPLYRNLLVSEDGTFTAISIKTNSHSSIGQGVDVLEGFEEEGVDDPTAAGANYLTDKENSEVVRAVHQVVDKYQAPDFKIFLAGSPVVTGFLKKSMMADMRKFMVLSLGAVSILLFIMFRRVSGVVLPLLTVILSLLATLGIMALTGTAIKVPTQILPSFLLAVGVGTSVHILAIFYRRLQQSQDKEEAIAYALGHSGLAVVMTNVTTACGLMSFSTSEVAPVADLGLFAGIGVLLTFVNTLVLLPAVIALLPIKIKKSNRDQNRRTLMGRFLDRVSHFSTQYPVPILVVSFLIMGLSLAAALQNHFSHDVLKWFPENNEIRQSTEKIDHALRGTINLEVLIDLGEENGFYDPEVLNRLEKASAHVGSLEMDGLFIGKAWSLTTILKEINQALNENRPEYYTIPQERDLVAQEFLLFENSGSDDLEDIVDSQFSKVRFTVKGPFEDAVRYNGLIESVLLYFEENFPEADITLTGMMGLMATTLNHAIVSMAKSYAIALAVITVLMVILIGKFRIGLLSMIPNLAPIILVLGVIGATPFKLDLFTMMVASIAIGLAVDDTIHFMHNFRRYYEQSGDPRQAVHETLHSTGRAMLVTTIVLSLGFFIFVFASMNNLFAFGLLTAFTIVMALAADYLLAPALMVLVHRGRKVIPG